LTMPGLGAFAMTTSVRSLLGECAVFSLEDSIGDRYARTHAGRGIPGLR